MRMYAIHNIQGPGGTVIASAGQEFDAEKDVAERLERMGAARPAKGKAAKEAPVETKTDEEPKMALKDAVLSLDPNEDAHWTKKDGLPDLNVLKEYTGKAVTRADVEAVAEGYDREAAAGGETDGDDLI